MQIEICFSPSLIQLYEHRDSVVVVTDVFRATTTICTAFANGASYIIPVATEQEALAYKSLGHLVGAEQVKGVLLTSDKNLRTTARIRGVDVHGHLWMFDEMVRIRSLMLSDAIIKLTELRTVVNPKLGLPANECEIRLKTWGEQNR